MRHMEPPHMERPSRWRRCWRLRALRESARWLGRRWRRSPWRKTLGIADMMMRSERAESKGCSMAVRDAGGGGLQA